MAEEEEDDDVFTIMVATDSHLGYCDRDAVRGTDSFAAFEEDLRLANDRGADFLLLAGDLFHDNKPSRRTLFKTMSLLRRSALSDAAVEQMNAWQESHQPERHGTHQYSAEEYGLDPGELSDAFREYRDRYGIPSE